MQEAIKHWKKDEHSFAKVSAKEFFKAVDMDGNGEIEFEEFSLFWRVVRQAGHSEATIMEELERIKNRESWVGFTNWAAQFRGHASIHNRKEGAAEAE